MKHHLRTDHTCLNCGTTVPDRFCPHCGQENIEPKEKTSHLIRHFFEDITHYDSKFFTTIQRLLFKPGFLTKEYFLGRRARHLNPVRMYVFISAVFFLVLYLNKPGEKATRANDDATARLHLRKQLADSLYKVADTRSSVTLRDSVEKYTLMNIASSIAAVDTTRSEEQSVSVNLGTGGIIFVLKENKYSRVVEYDSVQNALPSGAKDKGLLYWLIRTNIKLKERYGSRSEVVVKENFNRNVPKLMFILLPLFALFVKWFHNKKTFYYPQHVIFSVHYHSFVFLLFLLLMLMMLIFPAGGISTFIQLSGVILLFLYLVFALKTTYNQSFWKALVKGFAITLLYVIILIVCLFLLAAFIFFTA